jgi:hypothetical protein
MMALGNPTSNCGTRLLVADQVRRPRGLDATNRIVEE